MRLHLQLATGPEPPHGARSTVSVVTLTRARTRVFPLGSRSKPLTYALCLEHLGADVVHRFVGQEPSGRNFNELVLDHNNRPHNPMVNSGAIVVCSMLKQLLRPEMTSAQKFEFTLNFIQRMAGGEKLGFNNAVFVSERDAQQRWAQSYVVARPVFKQPAGTNHRNS
ncbi:putative glutaminase 2 [Frankliniella occidentalis]|uniref:glutaminase n=1 Tax=Frankliniella occidentalis TaxID=133901 RepID=A0A9C6XUN8_FRAOC|nr:putative glutaminase 2 [Frankliniella occidentalis]